MDVNRLLHDHQMAKLNAQYAVSGRDRDDSTNLIGKYAAQITAWRKAEGLSDTGWPRDERSCSLVIA